MQHQTNSNCTYGRNASRGNVVMFRFRGHSLNRAASPTVAEKRQMGGGSGVITHGNQSLQKNHQNACEAINAFVHDLIAKGDPRTPEQIEDGMWQPGARGHHLIRAEREAYKSLRRGSLESANARAGGL
jgi:hypothetical protein